MEELKSLSFKFIHKKDPVARLLPHGRDPDKDLLFSFLFCETQQNALNLPELSDSVTVTSDYTLCRGSLPSPLHDRVTFNTTFPLKPAALCGFLFMLNLTQNKGAVQFPALATRCRCEAANADLVP